MVQSRLIRFLAVFLVLAAALHAAPPPVGEAVKADPQTHVLLSPTAAQFASANHLGATPGTGNPRLGFVATNCHIPVLLSGAGPNQIMSRTYHVSTDDISSVMLAYSNWFNYEQSTGSPATVTASVEYPQGTYTQITFSGSSTGVIAAGANIFSDLVAVHVMIPRGSGFWVRTYLTTSGSYSLTNGSSSLDANNNGASGIADLTMTSGSIAPNKLVVKPTAIIGYTGKPSILLLGDSRAYGAGECPVPTREQADLSGTQGYERFVAKYGGYANFGNPGEAGADFIGTHSKRVEFAQYATHVVCDYGINDIQHIGVNLSQLQSTVSTIVGYFPGKPVYWTTFEPFGTSTDNWATINNQTPNANDSVRIAWNDGLRAQGSGSGYFGLAGYAEVADTVETSRNSGYWRPGTTVDGAHMNPSDIPVVTAVSVPIFGDAHALSVTTPGLDYVNPYYLVPDTSGTLVAQHNANAFYIHGAEISGFLHTSACGYWRNRTGVAPGASWQLDFNPLVPSDTHAVQGFIDIACYADTSACTHGFINVYYFTLPGSDMVAITGNPRITASGSVTVADGDVITDGAGASAKAIAGTGATISFRWINGTKWFTTGNTLSKNGTSMGVTVSSPGTMTSGQKNYLLYLGYDTGGTIGLTFWNGMNATEYPAIRMQF